MDSLRTSAEQGEKNFLSLHNVIDSERENFSFAAAEPASLSGKRRRGRVIFGRADTNSQRDSPANSIAL